MAEDKQVYARVAGILPAAVDLLFVASLLRLVSYVEVPIHLEVPLEHLVAIFSDEYVPVPWHEI